MTMEKKLNDNWNCSFFQTMVEKNYEWSPKNLGYQFGDQKPSNKKISITKKMSLFDLMDEIDMSKWILTW